MIEKKRRGREKEIEKDAVRDATTGQEAVTITLEEGQSSEKKRERDRQS